MKLGKDKILHIAAGAVIALVALLLFDSAPIAMILAITGGGFKEFWDSRGNGCVELADFIYTALGGAGGVFVWILMQSLQSGF